MLTPKRVKHRKWQTDRSRKRTASRGTEITFGTYGLKAMEPGEVSSRQLEAGRRAIIRYLRKGGKLWIRVFPDRPVTRQGSEVPMGGGKGGVDHYTYRAERGRVIYEVDGVPEAVAREALEKAGGKLAVKTRFVKPEQ